ncbi:putative DNA primase/helicase [Plantibacter flavus]|uniref:Putative DNA primase/helicase n=1 Tax=Plantibacter flavus TaxID=150123 RepID=A0A3N2BL74_9MICO|nr:phage/plasmid primase, P4 family [Plantibacter flavus]ROR76033.1 putative DNA primase/helicase [Plantibacter flavus]SMG49102.1 putative DNA primase/helicase [Plantibacter flavus]
MATTQNEITIQATRTYLASIKSNPLPSPAAIEESLLAKTNALFALENSGRTGSHRINLLKRLTFSQVAEILISLHRVVRIAPSGKNTDRDHDLLAIYVDDGEDEGIYATSEDQIRSIARLYNRELTINESREVMTVLREEAPRVSRCADRDMIAVNNGVFDYRKKELKPFDPSMVFLSKARVDYVQGALSPGILTPDGETWEVESWMHTLTDDPEIIVLLWEILGAIVRPHVRWNKSAWFFSELGNNGKGTLVELMRNLVGSASYASIPISDFGKEFLLEPLTRASAILVDENDVGTFIDRAANLKAIITNDVISINRKHKTPIAYQFWGFMVQCLNEFPRIKDKSESFYRRQLFVPFTKSFTGAEKRYIKDDYVGRDDVLQYVLHRVLHMNYYTLSEPEATKNVLEEYKGFNDPVRSFWTEFEEAFVWDLVPFAYLYDLYKAWFAKTNPSGSPIGRIVFVKDLLAIVHKSTLWHCADQRQQVRPGKMMDSPEPLTARFDLKDWMNQAYTGSDPLRKSTVHPLSSSYRGLQRTNTPPAAAGAVSAPGGGSTT